MRQQTQVSRVLPFSLDYQGAHPAGLWLTHALQKYCFHVAPPLVSDAFPLFYALDQSFLRDLAEPMLLFPLEWCEQSLTAQVTYSREGADMQIVDASPIAITCLDLHKLGKHLTDAFKQHAPLHFPRQEDTQPLSLAWEWVDTVSDTDTSHRQPWCVSGELPMACASFGVLQTHRSENVTVYFCCHPGTQTTWFTAEIFAENAVQAIKNLVQKEIFLTVLAKSGAIDEVWLQQHLKKSAIIWPEISWAGKQILITSQKPDLRPASLKIEGYCWGLMTHLLYYLNTRYSSPDAVFHRLQHFGQKMRGVLSPFL